MSKRNERGAGRKPIPAELKKVSVSVTLPPELAAWLKMHPNRSGVVERALEQYRSSMLD